ncbi:hypothetical protein M0R45_009437 [Rubus argutus]|uniref:Uncharacterized protein n=1 Tax=Rubus argutus TaxID=59490 RepID=A0AAW1Y4R5_RUBAR
MSTMRIADIPDEVFPSESIFVNTLSKLGHVLPQPTAVVMNFYEELNSTPLISDLKSKFRKLLHVGFLSLSLPLQPLPESDSDATGCLSWLDEQRVLSVAYISSELWRPHLRTSSLLWLRHWKRVVYHFFGLFGTT